MDILVNKKGLAIALLILLLCFLYYQNNSIVVSKIKLKYDKLPKEFNEFKIVHLSDLHNKMFGNNQKRLTTKIKNLNPDIIVITGDIVDSRRYDPKPALILIDNLKDIAPIYYVTGNHEFRITGYQELENKMRMKGVKVLRNTKEVIKVENAYIQIVGIDDPSGSKLPLDKGEKIRRNIELVLESNQAEDYFTILLSHRPEFFPIYSEYKVDLTLAGHAHGGQIRLPIIGGVIAPNQGLFPKFTAGKYVDGKAIMVVSRGLGNSIVPQRIFNRPEVVIVELFN